MAQLVWFYVRNDVQRTWQFSSNVCFSLTNCKVTSFTDFTLAYISRQKRRKSAAYEAEDCMRDCNIRRVLEKYLDVLFAVARIAFIITFLEFASWEAVFSYSLVIFLFFELMCFSSEQTMTEYTKLYLSGDSESFVERHFFALIKEEKGIVKICICFDIINFFFCKLLNF